MAPHISLMLAVDEAPRAADWYTRALGAAELWNLGSVIGLEIDGAPLFLHEPTTTGFVSPAATGETTVRVELFADDPDTLFQRAIDAGAHPTTNGIRTYEAPWGIHRQGSFRDPFGHTWHIGDHSPLHRHARPLQKPSEAS